MQERWWSRSLQVELVVHHFCQWEPVKGFVCLCCGCMRLREVQANSITRIFYSPRPPEMPVSNYSTGDTAVEAMKLQMSTWTIQKLKQASSCCTRNLHWKHFWEWHLIFIKSGYDFISVGQSKPGQNKYFMQFFSIVFVWQCYPKLTASLALHFLKWEPESLLAVHVLNYFYF